MTTGRLTHRAGFGEIADAAGRILDGIAGRRLAAYLTPRLGDSLTLPQSSALLNFSFAPLFAAMVLATVPVLLTHLAAGFVTRKLIVAPPGKRHPSSKMIESGPLHG